MVYLDVLRVDGLEKDVSEQWAINFRAAMIISISNLVQVDLEDKEINIMLSNTEEV